jgi:hypothetical protein
MSRVLRRPPCSPDISPRRRPQLDATLCADSCRAVPVKLLARTPTNTLGNLFFPELNSAAASLPTLETCIRSPVVKVLHVPDVWTCGQHLEDATQNFCYLTYSSPGNPNTHSIESTADDPSLCNASQSYPLLLVTPTSLVVAAP